MAGVTQVKKKEKYIEGTVPTHIEPRSYMCINLKKFKGIEDIDFDETISFVVKAKVTRLSKDEYGNIADLSIVSISKGSEEEDKE